MTDDATQETPPDVVHDIAEALGALSNTASRGGEGEDGVPTVRSKRVEDITTHTFANGAKFEVDRREGGFKFKFTPME